MKTLKAADLFCGAGGTSIGAHQTGGVDVRFALNHWDRAIETHSLNFPKTKHARARLNEVKPAECDKIDLLFASPECTHHSRARGGRPTSDQQRSGAWEIMPWIEHHRPRFICIENVVEFESWGPVGSNGIPLKSKRGAFFQAWIAAIESAGYRVEWQALNAANFGAATSRNRLFVVARKGNRSIPWPEQTHARISGGELPGMESQPYRGAIEIIDWQIPLPSVFVRKKPLADKTLARIQSGLKRHVEPFLVKLRANGGDYDLSEPVVAINRALTIPYVATVNHGDSGDSGYYRTRDSRRPLPTLTTSRGEGIVAPYFVPRHGEREGLAPRSHSGEAPLPAIATSNAASLAVPLVLSCQSGGAARDVNEPVPTITTKTGSQIVVPWFTEYYGNSNCGPSASQPLHTITTKDRHALTAAGFGKVEISPRSTGEKQLKAEMDRLGVCDIGFRMLANSELAAAQGFPPDYQFCGTKVDVTKQIGNSVSPNVAKAITEALIGA